MAWNAGVRLELVVRPLSLLLRAVQIALVIGVVAGAALAVGGSLKVLAPARDKEPVILGAVLMVAIAVVVAAVAAKVPAVRELAGTLPSRCKRLIFLACRGSTRLSHQVSHFCRLVASDFRAVQLLHPSQTNVIEKIYANISANTVGSSDYDAIVAPSGFGKTRCATLLAEALIRDKVLCGLADKCLYYDFARGDSIQTLFMRRLGGLIHSGALVIVDNFHLAPPSVVEETTSRLLNLPGPKAERHVLLLAQPPGAWRLHGQSEVKLLSEARRRGRLHEIRQISAAEIDLTRPSPEARRRIKAMIPRSGQTGASIAEIHSAQIELHAPEAERQIATRISDYLFPHAPEPGRWEGPEPLPQVLGTATALALHRGAFSLGAFRQAYAAVLGRTGPGGWAAQLRASFWLRRLARIGLFPRTSLPGRLYVLHEVLAEYFRDHIGPRDARFESAFRQAMIWRLDVDPSARSPAMQWLGAAELRDLARLAAHFDGAMVDGNLAAMARRLGANLPHLSGAVGHYQQGVILDKHGSFAEAREQLATAIAEDSEGIVTEAAELALIEAAHGPDRTEAVTRLGASSRQEIRLSAAYWRYHMDAHLGAFDPDGLTALAAQLTEVFEPDRFAESFVLAQLASRVYFDACRHVFLRREDVSRRLQRLANLPIVEVLANCDPSYRAASLLYGQAHVLAFVALTERALFGRPLPASELVGVVVESEDLEGLCSQTEAAYRHAQDEYAVFGNREQLYLKADILNARLQRPAISPHEVSLSLSDYADFIRRAGFEDIASYPEAYGFRLALKARQWALSGAAERSQHFDSADDHERQARFHLAKMQRMDETCGNRYGQWRGRFYDLLFDSISARSAPARAGTAAGLKALAGDARRLGYIGDADLIDRFLDQGDLSVGRIFNALLYHPFVHQ
jgi:hypothetical protein